MMRGQNLDELWEAHDAGEPHDHAACPWCDEVLLEAEGGHVPPESVQANAKRGLEMQRNGEGGDGLESATVARARKIADGAALTDDHVKRMHSFFERHDKTRPDDGGSGKSPWRTAWMLWGGDAGRRWAASVAKSLTEAEAQSDDHGEFASKVVPMDKWSVWPQNDYCDYLDRPMPQRMLPNGTVTEGGKVVGSWTEQDGEYKVTMNDEKADKPEDDASESPN